MKVSQSTVTEAETEVTQGVEIDVLIKLGTQRNDRKLALASFQILIRSGEKLLYLRDYVKDEENINKTSVDQVFATNLPSFNRILNSIDCSDNKVIQLSNVYAGVY